MTRPQMLILYEKTLAREYEENVAKEKAKWSHTAQILATLYNTAMGNKRKHKPKDFMPDFDENPFIKKDRVNELIDKAEKLGLKTPSTKKI